MIPDHIHDIGIEDFKGRRDVFVNGKRVAACFYADTRKGVVKAYRKPYKIDKHRKRALSYTLHGDVEVKFRNHVRD